MRIGMVSCAAGDGYPEMTHPSSFLPALASALVERDHEVVLLARRAGGSTPAWLTRTGVGIRELSAGPSRPLPGAQLIEHVRSFVDALRQELAGGGFDLLHSHGWLAGLATHLIASTIKTPLVHTFHELRLIEQADPVVKQTAAVSRIRVERAVARHADHLIATNTAERDALIRAGVSRARITVIPPGVPGEPSDDRDAERRRHRHRLVTFGPPRNAADVVSALPSLPHTELVVCGTPAQPISQATEALTALAGRLGVTDRVHLDHRATAHDRAPLIHSADAVLCLAPSSHQGNEHLEAMALGVPVIAGNHVAAEAVVHGVTGLNALRLDRPQLAVTLRQLLANHPLREAMGIAARDRATARYAWPRIAGETLAVYQRLLPSPVHPTPHPVPEPRNAVDPLRSRT